MSNGFLSQEEINALLNGDGSQGEEAKKEATDTELPELPDLTDLEKDLLGEVGNISMGSASTALSTIINQQVNITTPVVSVTTLERLKNSFEIPNIALEVKYTSGIVGENLLVMKIDDASVISNLMMGGNGIVEGEIKELSEIEISAVSEAMNQMIGSAATSMATMFAREVNISPPLSKIWSDLTAPLAEGISDDEPVVLVSFSLNIGELVDSSIMQLLPMKTAKKIVAIMMGEESMDEPSVENNSSQASTVEEKKPAKAVEAPKQEMVYEKPIEREAPKVEVKQASFEPLSVRESATTMPNNIDLILDVPLQISVVLGRTKMNVKDILNLGNGSLIELDKLAEEPVEIQVNGKKVAYGEVVVVDENFGVRITSIVSSQERIKSLGK
ncbi:flagellar motor switch phosphatase FliY [Clostridium botulinum]|uniref:Flagellar motor switch phosphatase FliY n=2 Tax=Clostridium botulinum TaxID=1491 RepID=A0A0L9ZXT4_CLOBO|nr:flagellar motor switch phosphatase FliY [Clostridium botulinum]EPS46505.1 flagellar motor switch protein [Clostridium botulinum CFSAN002367]APC82640.1 flagellar motor switch protein FliN [Clostridium botulinum]APH20328.1 flagellar motor switch protein FliN [Clostridium botulinum]AUM92235.1 flagellar motor switch phosphatase FliY [Clostridium botulinum]AUM99994.1 flagellar motor switch phosphatase FliY [Clostridium botulinum]